MIEIARLYTDSEGNSHFEDWPISMEHEGAFGYTSDEIKTHGSFYFQNTLPHHEWSLHQAPSKMYIVILDGQLEIEASDGEKRVFSKGNVVCLEDDSGNGHKTRTIKDSTQSSLIIKAS